RVAYKLRKILSSGELFDADSVAAHHSSLSREVRLDVEEKLKKGELKAVVSSTSLELGIDIGYIDLVVLLSSPKSVSRLLQRIGRAGHHIKAVSEGKMIVIDRDDLVECAVLAQLARERKIDSVHIPKKPLDVLVQAIIAASLIEEVDADELYTILKKTYTFSDLTYEEYKSVLDYVTGKYGLEENKVYAKVRMRGNKLVPKFGSRMIFFLNSGTIPDEAKVPVRLESGRYIGNLEEEFAEILSPGDIFVLAGKTYEFVGSRAGEVIVRPAEGQRPTVPSWFSEMLPLAYDSAREIAKFRGEVARLIAEGRPREEVISYIQKRLNLRKREAESIYIYVL
ncbi:MAG: ATP-dependent helicase, partial [Sulfolobales archaeon]|nr:ATP-dependent helicase [Sulfolobales archaeon]